MRRTTANAIVDTIALIPFLVVAVTAVIIYLYLPRGTQSAALGTIASHQTFLGIQRQIWLDVHTYLGLVLIALVAAHLILHWYYLSALPQRFAAAKTKKDRSAARFIALLLVGAGLVVAVIVAVYAVDTTASSASQTPLSESGTATAISRALSPTPSLSTATTASPTPTSINGIPTSINGLNYTYYHELNDRTTCRLCHTNL